LACRETAALENATSYFPLLDVIAEGVFQDVATEKELYEKFSDILVEYGHMRDAEALSSFKFALALRAAAPRIEAHFQFYNTSVEPGMMAAQDAACPVWVYLDGKQYCSPALDRAQQDIPEDSGEVLPFDRVFAEPSSDGPHSILYADITHPLFGQFHETVCKTARDGRSSYRVRYRPSTVSTASPLYLNGYGVELVLKRTDYIVIDDRDDEKPASETSEPAGTDPLHDDASDLKPLTTSELSKLGLNAASYIMSSPDPFDTLLKVSNNFPKYSSRIASHNATPEFLAEYRANRAAFLPQGFNILWMNGLQVETRQINAFSLHENLARERKLINQMRELGLSAQEAVSLLSHEVIAQAQVEDEPQRYDWRDEAEGGDVIMWLNDIEQDDRYAGWPGELNALLQRTYPGQLPQVRRDITNLVFPVDLASPKDLKIIVEILQNFVKRQVPVRIGLVPTLSSLIARENAQAAYHILDTYGLSTLMTFFDSLAASKMVSAAGEASFSAAVENREIREGQTALAYSDVLDKDAFKERSKHITAYLDRLALAGTKPPFLVNGIAIPHSDNWLDVMSTRISLDLRTIQRGVYEETILEDTWVPLFFLFQAALRRNALVIPEDLKTIRVLDVSELSQAHAELFDSLPRLGGAEATLLSDRLHMVLVADLDTHNGHALVSEAMAVAERHPEIEVLIVDSASSTNPSTLLSKLLEASQKGKVTLTRENVQELLLDHAAGSFVEEATESTMQSRASADTLLKALGFAHGENGIWLNGRLVGPITGQFNAEDFETLFSFETARRVIPVTTAITGLGLEERFTIPLDLAKVTALLSRAHKSDVPEGIYESSPLIRMDKFDIWNSTHSAIHLSNTNDPTVQIVAAIDPASEVVQHWIPILKTLSELHGVDVKIFLNPKEKILELPIKRFYRQVIQSAPVFDEAGALAKPQASFTKVPEDALLNLGMVVPPSWLVAPEECVYDLDNIKLSSLPKGQDIDALYELENILIEGHSRDLTRGPPPRGVQLLLGTEQSPHFTDTLIMANLGYFQFKANPGYWHISLQPGRSSKIFHIDSVGAKGYAPQLNDESTSVALLSFQGATLFPRLSRNPGMEDEDVLEGKDSTLDSILSKGASFLGFNSKSLTTTKSQKQADINIFSVASGHLYERMLNIMMLSVMKHTTHTVKFWFIEQFLSPSFKSFLPHLAAHYGFEFEMVTYKWPHWLRGQKEKQREIWGYKILFLDVLFPLSLQKVIFVDADQIVRTDMMNLNKVDLEGAPYGFTPMCDSRTEMEGFRFWKQGYWKNFLQGRPYHISALFVVDLVRFRQLAAGDRLRQQYHQLSADPESLSNLDQDLPNHMQHVLPIHSLSQEWLWCETWCADEALGSAKTIDLCNNPLTKEPKLDRARRQVPEWTEYDDEVDEVRRGVKARLSEGEGVPTRRRDEL
jgi:UDP-glucose:glycoprotein glucosyltransferase